MTRWLPGAACCLLLVSCAGTTSQLSKFKADEQSNQYAAIASQSIAAACAGGGKGSAECAQLAAIQGRACFTLAKQEAAPHAACPPPTDSARRRLQCAATDFDAARAGTQFSRDDLNDFTEMRARALYCGATFESRHDGLPAAREAAHEVGTLPANARRDQLAAAAALYEAFSDDVSIEQRCRAAQLAIEHAERGLASAPDDALQEGLHATREHAAGVAAHLANCQVD